MRETTVLVTATAAKSLQLCLTLCDLIDGSPPGSPVPGILQARTLEWAAIAFSSCYRRAVNPEGCQAFFFVFFSHLYPSIF